MKRFILLPLLLITLACGQKDSTSKAASDKLSDKIKLSDLSGAPIDLTIYEGRTLVINFWATWCRPCVKEMPSFEKAKARFDENKVVFLFASDEEVERIQNFRAKNNLSLNFVQVTNLEELQIQALPTTYIIDPTGALALTETGGRNWDDDEMIERIKKISQVNE
jgi:thiol-disulfide isomerase/thioredoxin